MIIKIQQAGERDFTAGPGLLVDGESYCNVLKLYTLW